MKPAGAIWPGHAEPASGWNPWLWAWSAAKTSPAHRLLMEKAHTIEPHGVYFCNADDTTAPEPSLELIIRRYRPEYLDLVQDLPGHASFSAISVSRTS